MYFSTKQAKNPYKMSYGDFFGKFRPRSGRRLFFGLFFGKFREAKFRTFFWDFPQTLKKTMILPEPFCTILDYQKESHCTLSPWSHFWGSDLKFMARFQDLVSKKRCYPLYLWSVIVANRFCVLFLTNKPISWLWSAHWSIWSVIPHGRQSVFPKRENQIKALPSVFTRVKKWEGVEISCLQAV